MTLNPVTAAWRQGTTSLYNTIYAAHAERTGANGTHHSAKKNTKNQNNQEKEKSREDDNDDVYSDVKRRS